MASGASTKSIMYEMVLAWEETTTARVLEKIFILISRKNIHISNWDRSNLYFAPINYILQEFEGTKVFKLA